MTISRIISIELHYFIVVNNGKAVVESIVHCSHGSHGGGDALFCGFLQKMECFALNLLWGVLSLQYKRDANR